MFQFLSADAAKRRFGGLLKQADEFPVILTRHGKPRYVVMSAQLFEALHLVAQAHETRKIVVSAASSVARFADRDPVGGMAIISEAHGALRRLRRLVSL